MILMSHLRSQFVTSVPCSRRVLSGCLFTEVTEHSIWVQIISFNTTGISNGQLVMDSTNFRLKVTTDIEHTFE